MSSRQQPQLQQHTLKGNMSPDKAWESLQSGIVSILHHKPMTKKSYLDLYNFVYQYCTSSSATTADDYRQRELRSTEFLGQQLYNHLREFLKNHLLNKSKEGSDRIGDSVLAFYSNDWSHYTFSCQVIHNIFLYLNRHWVRRELEDGRKDIYEIYSLLLVSWRENFLGTLLLSVRSAVLKLVENERNGKTIESKYVQCIVKSYVDLGIENSMSSRGRILTYYKSEFEKYLLEETKSYYQMESSKFLDEHSVTAYVTKAENRLADEKSRSDRLFHETTLAPLISLCEDILISQYLPRFHEEFQALLNDERTEDIGKMYHLVKRVKNSLPKMKEILQAHITHQGLEAIKAVKDTAQMEPHTYARALLKVNNTYKSLIMKAFNNDGLFIQALDEACRTFINKNAVIEETKNKNKTSELLARYSDLLLKKSSKLVEEGEHDEVLQHVVLLLHYIEDKDVFSKYYISRLAKRLIGNLSVSEDAERSMILKLKEAFGGSYTIKMEKMFGDVELSKGLNDQFRHHLETTNTKVAVDFGIQVLTQGQWPLPQCGNLAIPTELDLCVQRFNAFYSAHHSGRKLIWDYAQSSGDLTGNYQKRKYTFTVSTYQMAVLLQYNSFPERTFEQLQENTQISQRDLELVVRTLMKLKLLLGDGVPSEEAEEIPGTAVISLYEEFRHKKLRINANVPLRIETKREEESINRTIDNERRYEIEAAIVRVMKTRKTLKHNELLTEVVELLKRWFKPSFPAIKKRIEDLIDRKYLERSPDHKDVYIYLA